MDTNEDWAEKKEQEKNDRFSSHLGFINHLSHREKSDWKASQTNLTTGVRGSLHTNQFLTRLESLGVKNISTREAIRNRTVHKTLSMSDMILKNRITPIQVNIQSTIAYKKQRTSWHVTYLSQLLDFFLVFSVSTPFLKKPSCLPLNLWLSNDPEPKDHFFLLESKLHLSPVSC